MKLKALSLSLLVATALTTVQASASFTSFISGVKTIGGKIVTAVKPIAETAAGSAITCGLHTFAQTTQKNVNNDVKALKSGNVSKQGTVNALKTEGEDTAASGLAAVGCGVGTAANATSNTINTPEVKSAATDLQQAAEAIEGLSQNPTAAEIAQVNQKVSQLLVSAENSLKTAEDTKASQQAGQDEKKFAGDINNYHKGDTTLNGFKNQLETLNGLLQQQAAQLQGDEATKS